MFSRALSCTSILVFIVVMGVAPDSAAQDSKTQSPSKIDATLERLRDELKQILEQERVQRGQSEPSGTRDRGARPLQGRGQTLARMIRDRVSARLEEVIERELGPMAPLQSEAVMLEALDKRGKTIEIPYNAAARPLRSLNVPEYSARAYTVLETEGLALSLYDVLPDSVEPERYADGYQRVFTGPDADALAAEAKLVVTMKGGEWREPDGTQSVANAVAVRGLDLDTGLQPNDNKTYDDTMYLIVDSVGAVTEVYEYRMTTESSSTSKGVGRLNSMQVIYVRGLHKGKDPAYRLKGDAAEGTRAGMEGTQRILGANIHSAYAKRPIDSTTPLSPKVSLGCQVLAASKKDFEKTLVGLLDSKGIKEFPYTIVEGDELAILDKALNERGKHSLLIEGIPRQIASAGQ